MPRLRELLDEAETCGEIKKLAISLYSAAVYVNDDLMNAFERKVSRMVDEGKFSGDNGVGAIIKTLGLLLSKKDWTFGIYNERGEDGSWFDSRSVFVRRVALQLKGRMKELRPPQVQYCYCKWKSHILRLY